MQNTRQIHDFQSSHSLSLCLKNQFSCRFNLPLIEFFGSTFFHFGFPMFGIYEEFISVYGCWEIDERREREEEINKSTDANPNEH